MYVNYELLIYKNQIVLVAYKMSKTTMTVSRAGRYGQKNDHDNFFISVDIYNYHDKCQIFISFKFKDRFLLQSESCRNQTINFP